MWLTPGSLPHPAVDAQLARRVIATQRNNVGGWPCRRVETKARPGTFEFYAAKDQAMAAVANVGFMLWDGESGGTLMNVWRLLRGQKSTLVAVQPTRALLDQPSVS